MANKASQKEVLQGISGLPGITALTKFVTVNGPTEQPALGTVSQLVTYLQGIIGTGSFGMIVNITLADQSVTIPNAFSSATAYASTGVISDFNTSGATLQGITNQSGTEVLVHTSVQPCQVYLTFTGI